jgi:hypothetical protein
MDGGIACPTHGTGHVSTNRHGRPHRGGWGREVEPERATSVGVPGVGRAGQLARLLRLGAALLVSGSTLMAASDSPPTAETTTISPPAGASGRVLDALGRPIGGAEVELATATGQRVAVAHGDRDGRFNLPAGRWLDDRSPRGRRPVVGLPDGAAQEGCLPDGPPSAEPASAEPESADSPPGDSLVLRVAAPGFAPWAGRIPANRADRPTALDVALDPELDAAWFARLRALSGATEREHQVALLLAHDHLREQLAAVFPFLAEIRRELLVATGWTSRQTVQRRSPFVDEAHLLLALLGDPADRERLAPWLAANPWVVVDPAALPPLAPAAGADLCTAWAAAHLAREGCGTPLWSCDPLVWSVSGERGLLRFSVFYAHWGYDLWVVFSRAEDGWLVAAEVAGTTDHYLPGPAASPSGPPRDGTLPPPEVAGAPGEPSPDT